MIKGSARREEFNVALILTSRDLNPPRRGGLRKVPEAASLTGSLAVQRILIKNGTLKVF